MVVVQTVRPSSYRNRGTSSRHVKTTSCLMCGETINITSARQPATTAVSQRNALKGRDKRPEEHISLVMAGMGFVTEVMAVKARIS